MYAVDPGSGYEVPRFKASGFRRFEFKALRPQGQSFRNFRFGRRTFFFEGLFPPKQ